MKLIIQIPCFNEEQTLPLVLADLPRRVAGFDVVEWLIIDDGSTDRTIEVARAGGVDHIVRLTNNKGLAAGLPGGPRRVPEARRRRHRQHRRRQPVRRRRHPQARRADPRAARPTWSSATARSTKIEHFSPLKVTLQRLGSWVVRQASATDVPDTTSGFRAYNREAAIQMAVVSKFTYTLETIIQAGKQLVAIDHVADPDEPEDARVAPVPVDVVLRAPQLGLDLPDLLAVRAAAGLHDRGAVIGLDRARRLGALCLLLRRRGRGQGPRPVADPRRGAVQRGDGARARSACWATSCRRSAR